MRDGVTISTFELFKLFPNQETARIYLESRLWPNGVRCPYCLNRVQEIGWNANGEPNVLSLACFHRHHRSPPLAGESAIV